MRIVFLHGIGGGDIDLKWLDGLNRGLLASGFNAISESEVIAPRYSSTLRAALLPKGGDKIPDLTYRPADERSARRAFFKRQSDMERELSHLRARGAGYHHMPDGVVHSVQEFAVGHMSVQDLGQVRNYVTNDGVRGAVLRKILDEIPATGEIVLIGHSLGSVIAIDLLDHLPQRLKVRRFITIGSPAHSPSLHDKSERLLKKFPYERVEDWGNFYDARDVVTAGRGLAGTFSAAQDFRVDIGGSHAADRYLAVPAIAGLIGSMLSPREPQRDCESVLEVRMTDQDNALLLMLHYADVVQRKIKDAEKAAKFADAVTLRRDDIVAQSRKAEEMGLHIPFEIRELARGRLPRVQQRWEMHDAVRELAVLSMTNVIDPYEIKLGDAPLNALPTVAVEMGYPSKVGVVVAESMRKARAVFDKKGFPWGTVITGAAGLALLAAGPVGLMVAAPAGVAGAAAITSGLAALGPGGMVGGLMTLGTLAGTGAAFTTGALAAEIAVGSEVASPEQLVLEIAIALANRELDLPVDTGLWAKLAESETEVSAQINKLEPFSDDDTPRIKQLREARRYVRELIDFVMRSDIGPAEIRAVYDEASGTTG